MLTNQQILQLDLDLRALNIPIIGVSSVDGSREGITIQYEQPVTTEQIQQAEAIVDGYFARSPVN